MRWNHAGFWCFGLGIIAACAVSPTGAEAAAQRVVLPESVTDGVPTHTVASRPTSIVFGADGRVRLLALQWTRWGGAQAQAQGTEEEDVGAAGDPQPIDNPATVTATRLQRCDGHLTYTRLTVIGADPDIFTAPYDLTPAWRHCDVPAAEFCRAPRGIVWLIAIKAPCHEARALATAVRARPVTRVHAGGRAWRCSYTLDGTATCRRAHAEARFLIFDGPASE